MDYRVRSRLNRLISVAFLKLVNKFSDKRIFNLISLRSLVMEIQSHTEVLVVRYPIIHFFINLKVCDLCIEDEYFIQLTSKLMSPI
jgi:hypothetical protein